MRKILFSTAAIAALAFAAPSIAQPAPGDAPPPAAEAPAPDASTAAPPDAGTAPAPATDTAPAPKKKMHHHMAAAGSGWAHEPGTGESGPASASASNISGSDSHSDIAPHFPAPKSGMDSSPEGYLKDAKMALAKKHTGEAQQALEMAETRLLDRSTPSDSASQPAQDPEIMQVSEARMALGKKDMMGAMKAIEAAMAAAPKT